tara:strand:- start:9 stop:1112 length:1104 start_codon:yes stop_codon:yes gene_type:complete
MTRASDLAKLLSGGTISTADNTDQLTLTSTDADANQGPVLDLYRNSSSPADSDLLGEISFRGRNDNSQDVDYGHISGKIIDASDGTEDGMLDISTIKSGAKVSRVKITDDGTVLNEDSADIDFRVESNGNTHMLFVDGGNDKIGIGISNPASYDDGGDRLVVGDTSGRSGITIVTGTSNDGSINFADGTSGTASYSGYVNYHHNTNEMKLATNGNARLVIDSTGCVTMPSQPAFLAVSRSMSNIGSGSTLDFGTEVFDQNSDYNASSFTFTAPVTGRYFMSLRGYLLNLDNNVTYYQIGLRTSNRDHNWLIDPNELLSDDNAYFPFSVSALVDLDAADTAFALFSTAGGSQVVDLDAGSYFGGALIC